MVRNYIDCTGLLDAFKNDLEFISLDYHLGSESKHSGYDVLIYMHENGICPDHINIHSDHPVGAREMEEYATEHFKSSKITRNPAL